MTKLSSKTDGSLLPLYIISSLSSRTPSSSPPTYSPSPSMGLDPPDSSLKLESSRLAEERCRNNKRKALICIFLAVMLLLVLPLAVFSVVVSKAPEDKYSQ
ncbi:uncharacterized protein RSE6_04759 [Rhynchosporium secalis]|uniref:Uncharacterized protein n=1 Tax=Rhynchosporium secalis TaxID=38038 RepID=A0A1E1M627_RHYSE|nr:uncharacterized protein RSE6_04759 [Rhynchosporium secalis]